MGVRCGGSSYVRLCGVENIRKGSVLGQRLFSGFGTAFWKNSFLLRNSSASFSGGAARGWSM